MSAIIIALCIVGLFVSLRMESKARMDARGLVREPSVVQTPRARVLGRTSNSMLGLLYYALLGVAALFMHDAVVATAMLSAALLAAIMSAYLAYSLLFVTRMPCINCWLGHAVNWLLFGLLVMQRYGLAPR
jgi:uncharacterized membrane protein